jgi:hypothetical protein
MLTPFHPAAFLYRTIYFRDWPQFMRSLTRFILCMGIPGQWLPTLADEKDKRLFLFFQ